MVLASAVAHLLRNLLSVRPISTPLATHETAQLQIGYGAVRLPGIMRALILIPSCARDRELQFTQRALIEQDGLDYRFFLGAGNSNPAFDEVILPVRDDYWALPQKVRAA